MIQPIPKTCTRCGLELPLGRFSADRTRVDGLSKWCKGCVSENSRKHYEANREKILTATAQRRTADPEHFKAIARASEVRNDPDGERKKARSRKRYEAKREEILAKNRWQHMARKFGITAESFAAILADQGGGCAICGAEETAWHVDHDHACCPTTRTCGKCVRGILCRGCNIGLGNFRDDPELLKRAISYLQGQ